MDEIEVGMDWVGALQLGESCGTVFSICVPAFVRLSAGREVMDDGIQALAFFSGANSIFYGEQLLTTGNPDIEKDKKLFNRLNLSTL